MKGLVDNAAVRVWLGCGADSAEVASRYCMAAEVERRQLSFTHGREPTTTESYRTEQRQAVLPSEVQGLPPPHPGDPTVRAYVTANHLPAPVYCEEPLGEFFAFLDALPKVPAYRPRPAADRWPRPWDDQADGLRLEPLFEPQP